PRADPGGGRARARSPPRGGRDPRSAARLPARPLDLARGRHRPLLRRRHAELPRTGVDPLMAASISTPSVDWFALSPGLALLGAAAVALLAAVLVPAGFRRPFAAIACAAGFVGAFVAAALVYGYSAAPAGEIAGAISRDRWAA